MAAEPTPAANPPADPARGKAVVLYDGMCELCRRSVTILRRLDWLERLHYQDCRDTANLPRCDQPLVPARLLEEMHLVAPDRKRVRTGYRAFRWIVWRLPVLAPFAPLFYLPGVPWLGNELYLWVARNRYKLVPCKDGVCQIHFPNK